MPTKISSREVLEYLNDLGYNNISAQQLKEFMQDLKKLIKYEENKRYDGSLSSIPSQDFAEDVPIDIFAALHAKGTVESKAKIKLPKKESVIAVQIRRSKPHVCRTHSKEEIEVPSENSTSRSKPSDQGDAAKYSDLQQVPELLTEEPGPSGDSKKSANSNKSKPMKPKASFIRPAVKTNMKSDPVALYHQYQAEWKRAKIPGEDNRTDLRWAIREKMMGGPRIA